MENYLDNPVFAFRQARLARNQMRDNAKIKEEMKNYLTDPDATITAVNQYDPMQAIQLTQDRAATAAKAQAAALEAQKTGAEIGKLGAETGKIETEGRMAVGKEKAENAVRVTTYLRGLPADTDYGAVMDGMKAFLTDGLGMSPDEFEAYRSGIVANPSMILSLDEDAQKELNKAKYGVITATPGSHVIQGGKVIDSVPFAPRPVTVRRGDGGTDILDYNPNAPAAGGGGKWTGGPLTVDLLRPHFVAQESGGDYGAVNDETGAMGKYQVMPETGKGLAKAAGIPWRPDLMTSKTPEAMAYQDRLGDAAIQEAIDNGGGTPEGTFSYYYGGSDRSKWGPKTRKYTGEMMKRLTGGDSGGGVSKPLYSSAGKPADAGKGVRAATAQELAGYPPGTAAQIDANGKLVNLRTPPAGVQGAENKRAIAYQEAGPRVAAQVEQSQGVVNLAQSILNMPDLDSYVGSFQGRLPSWLSQGRDDFNSNLETLKVKIGFDALAAMREMSRTGGALGSISNQENEMLKRSLASLDSSQSETQFRKNLNEVIRVAKRYQKRLQDTYRRMGANVGGDSGGYAVGQIARNPSTGKSVRWNGRGWEPVR